MFSKLKYPKGGGGGGGICLPCHTHNKLVLFVVSIVARKVLSVPVLLVLK